jgi:hypothetical protein
VRGYSPFWGYSNFVVKSWLFWQDLRLVRCEFLTDESYKQLGELHDLTHLYLTRTITREKAPGQSKMRQIEDKGGKTREIRQVTELDKEVMNSLHSLMKNSLKTLDIAYCTALTEEHKQTLRTWGTRYGCEIKE